MEFSQYLLGGRKCGRIFRRILTIAGGECAGVMEFSQYLLGGRKFGQIFRILTIAGGESEAEGCDSSDSRRAGRLLSFIKLIS